MFTTLVLLTLAADARPWLGKNPSCTDDAKALHENGDVPEEFMRGELHHAPMVDDAQHLEKVCRLSAREYDKKANLWVGVIETAVLTPSGAGGYVVGPRTLVLGLFKFGDQALVTVAKTEKPLTLSQNEQFSGFDLAAFKLDEKHRAFGFRSRRATAYAGGGGFDETLRLFRDSDSADGLVMVFEALMSSSSTLSGGERNDGGTAVLQIAKTKTNGFFDWDEVVLKTKKKAAYRWNGKAYETKDDDPVEDVNAE